jgi:hypothetical protein
MAAVASHRHSSAASSKPADKPDNIPDIIEESRKQPDGSYVSNRYLRGKLLGKVCSTNFLYLDP